MPWWLLLLAGALPGGALGVLVDWLVRRGAGRERDLAVQRGTDLRASLDETTHTLDLERAAHLQARVRLEDDLHASEAERHQQAQRYDAVVRGKDLALARYRKTEATRATADSLADRADELGNDGLLPLPDSSGADNPAPARDGGEPAPVPGQPPAGPPPVAGGKGG